ncbi:hypothetical protein XENORESO_020481 [Xenotaenia resolanae]|uniref:Uncharacterized protein n=1 Tax=Xenotaenia resolanae TaxID=208358 RepID=A0ABV0XBA4_9TELE
MYKMYNEQWDEESDDEKNSLYSSFWSDGEVGDKDEEVEITRVIDPRPVNDPEGSPPESSREENPELKSQRIFNRGAREERSDDDENVRKATSSSSGSPTVSPMTSGYGTYRAEEQELAYLRDDDSVIRFNQDSREDLSVFRDNEEYPRSLRSFTEFDHEPTHGPDVKESVVCVSEDSRLPAAAACCEDDSTLKEIMKHVVAKSTSEVQHLHADADNMLLFHKKGLEDAIVENKEVKQEKLLFNVEKNTEHVFVTDVPDESSSSKVIRVIDPKSDFSWKTHEKMSKDKEGNLARMRGKCFLSVHFN